MSKELQADKALIKKYKKYVSNLEWHIKTNKPEGEALRRCEDKLKCFKEVLHDLNELPSPSPSKDNTP